MNTKASSNEKAVYSSKKRNVSVITVTVWSQFGLLMRTNERRESPFQIKNNWWNSVKHSTNKTFLASPGLGANVIL